AHEPYPGEDADVCQTVFAASGDASDVGQDEAEDDGNGRGRELAPGEHLRDQHCHPGDHADQGEGDDEVVVRQSRDQSFHHRSSANSSTGASTPGVFTRLSTGTRAKRTTTAAAPAMTAVRRAATATTTFCVAAMATTSAMYMTAQPEIPDEVAAERRPARARKFVDMMSTSMAIPPPPTFASTPSRLPKRL